MSFAAQLILALAVTAAVECLLIALIMRRRTAVWVCLWANVMTNPALNVILALLAGFISLQGARYALCLIILELSAVAAEGWAYRAGLGMSAKKALALSLVLNAVSYTAGTVIFPPI